MRRSNAVIGVLSLVPIGSALIPSAHILFATRGLQQQQRHYYNNDCCLTTTYNTISTQLDMRTRRRRRKRVRRGRHNHGSDGIAVTDDDEKCAIFLEDCDHTGIAKSIDSEYSAEEEKLGMSFWEVLER